jgi:hypothetical protein
MFEQLAIWYLRKKNKSVLIGYQLDGGKAKPLNSKAYVYDNRLNSVDYRSQNDKPFYIPEGKFNIKG